MTVMPQAVAAPGLAGASDARLSVAFLVSWFPKASEVFLLHTAAELSRRGHRVTFHALGPSGESTAPPEARPFLAEAVVGRMPRSSLRRALRAPALLLGGDPRRRIAALSTRRYGDEARTLRTLYRLDATGDRPLRCDVLHAMFADLGGQALMLRDLGLSDAPLVVSFRGQDMSTRLAGGDLAALAPVVAAAAACLPVASRWCAPLRDLGCPEERLTVLPSGLPVERLPRHRARDVGDSPRLLVAGRLEEGKGVEHALDALAAMRTRYPGASLDLFGDGPRRAALTRHARSAGVADAVRFHGNVPQERLWQAAAAADLHLFTSVTTVRGRTEGVPNVLKETQAIGLPAVAFDHPGVDEVVVPHETAAVVPEGDTAALAARAVELLGDRSGRQRMGRRAAVVARERFDIRPIVDRLEAVYRRCLAETSA